MDQTDLIPLLDQAIASRQTLIDSNHESAFRLFNRFSEGYPDLTLEIYGRTLVVHNYTKEPARSRDLILTVIKHVTTTLNWLRACIVKTRNGLTTEEKNGLMIFGDKPDTGIQEHGIWYAINLIMNRDTSFYLDTRNLRKWLIDNIQGKSVLNTFAYTGSLGVATQAGHASLTIQNDRNRKFLNFAKESYALNGFPINKTEFIVGDFFPTVAKLKAIRQFFDCVILDPPFFSTTSHGKVDQESNSARLINKVRPLIKNGGQLIAINNALYVSGREYLQTLEELCKDGYMQINHIIPVPKDCIGFNQIGKPITDPAPFNHSTKIVILDVKRKNN